MPLYEFRCAACDHSFETLTRTQQVPADLACPQCGSKDLRRLLSSFFAHSAPTGAKAAARPEQCRECPGGGPSCPFSS
ncbi:MAG: zinc ribbon domain-containing protein [Armatimonadetes bacterium]|nr:zinc ribbon domain-containing protein [Armatimonadota bacterium]